MYSLLKIKYEYKVQYNFGQHQVCCVYCILSNHPFHLLLLLTAIMHHIGRSLGLDCDCSDIHTCEVLVYGTGMATVTSNFLHAACGSFMPLSYEFL